MWVSNESQLSKEYTRKFRQLQASLRHDENQELRLKVLSGAIEPLAVTTLRADQLAPRSRQEQMEQQIRYNFESKIKLNDDADSAAGVMVVKTDQGLEFVSASKKKFDQDNLEEKYIDLQDQPREPARLPEPSTLAESGHGMPKEVYELYVDLEAKWSVQNLTRRFKERINDHLRVNTITRDNMLKFVDTVSAEYCIKAGQKSV